MIGKGWVGVLSLWRNQDLISLVRLDVLIFLANEAYKFLTIDPQL